MSAFTYSPSNLSNVCQTQLQELLSMYNPNTGNPQFSQLDECYDQIVAIYTSGTMTACEMLENILQLSCIELDSNGNLIIINPETGYPPNEGIDEGNDDTDEYICYTELVDYFNYLEYTYNLTFPDFSGEGSWGNFGVLPIELQNCIQQPYRYFANLIVGGVFNDNYSTYCAILQLLKDTNCYVDSPIVTEPEPEPYNPGEELVDTTPGDDNWQDNQPNPGTTPPDNPDTPNPIWWYHTDHLGSSTYLTDNFGKPTHYYDNLPFGETMVEHNQSNSTIGVYRNKYKFNGKELDDATGMYYYGARYYDPRISIFVSVDPLAEQTMEPYSYVGNNPIMFTDPTGMSKEGLEHDPPKEETLPELVINVRSKISQFCQGAKDGVIGFGKNTADFVKSLGTEEGWLNLARSQELMFSPAVNSNGDSYVKKEREQIYNSAKETFSNLDQYSAYDWGYGFGYGSASVASAFAVRDFGSGLRSLNYFGARGGYGLLGKNGLNMGNYRMDLMYSNPSAGLGAGTIFSLKQMKAGGSLFRLDYGMLHNSSNMGLHSTVRFYWGDTKFGSTAQRTWYPSSFKAPFFNTLK